MLPARAPASGTEAGQQDPRLRADTWAPLLLLALAAALGRWLTRSRLIYGWDTVHYLLAQDRYDILAHQPHAPGSFYYVLLARAVRLGTGDPHAALLVVSAASGAVLVVVLFLLGRELGGQRAGWLAAATAATAPLFWFYGSLGLNYGPAGVLSALFALGCVRVCRGQDGARGLLLAGAALGLLGGFRPTDTAFLAPAFLFAIVQHLRSGEKRAGRHAAWSAGVAAVLTLGWVIPTLVNTGGAGPYLEALRALEHVFVRSSVFRSGWPALSSALDTHWRTLVGSAGVTAGLSLAACLAGALARRPAPAAASGASRGLWVLGGLIAGPAALFYLLGHFNSPGYALTYAGFLAACAAAGAARLWRGGAAGFGGLVAGVALLNGMLFLARPAGSGQQTLSHPEIADHDRYYAEVGAFFRGSRERPFLLAADTSTDGLRIGQALVSADRVIVCQAVGHSGPLPEGLRRLPWLDLRPAAEIRAAGRTVYAIRRAREDIRYHQSLFPEGFDEVPIGPGHVLLRLRRVRP